MANAYPQTRRSFVASMLAAGAVPALHSADAAAYAKGKKAPEWAITKWMNRDGGSVASNKGKVIVIDFFQLWCPGCNKFSGPLMKHWQSVFGDEVAAGRLHMVKIHTVFEGHNYQTDERLARYIKDKGITLPVGVDRHVDGKHLPETMRRYNTRGTPEMAVIDKDGFVRFQQFGGFDHEPVQALIARLVSKAGA